MKKKFRLVKCYPDSPELGTEIFNDEVFKGHYYYKLKNHHKVDLGTLEPWKYPEFWEEVVEKDYEILLVSSKGTGKVYDYHRDWFIEADCNIYSVKRLSDGEVFTIGDVCCPNSYINNNHSIIKFELILNNTTLRVNSKNWYLGINDIIKSKPVLFRSEDGVDIYEGNGVFIVNKFFSLGFSKGVKYNNHKDNKFFSTKEKAEEYVLMNKPYLSLNDVNKAYKFVAESYSPLHNNLILQLKEVIKTK